jgi:hypothetical protein
MTIWYNGDIMGEQPNMVTQFNNRLDLRFSDKLISSSGSTWGPSPDILKKLFPQYWSGLNTTDQAISGNITAFGVNNTFWILDPNNPDVGVWGLNITDVPWVQAAQQAGAPMVSGWYTKLPGKANGFTLPTQAEMLAAQPNFLPCDPNFWNLYYQFYPGAGYQVKLATAKAQLQQAQQDAANAAQLQQVQSQLTAAQNAAATAAQAAATAAATPPTPNASAFQVGTTYELAASYNGQLVPADYAWQQPTSFQWALYSDGTSGYRLSGTPGIGPSLSGGQPPSTYNLPAYIVAMSSSGQPGIVNNSAMVQLFGANWQQQTS